MEPWILTLTAERMVVQLSSGGPGLLTGLPSFQGVFDPILVNETTGDERDEPFGRISFWELSLQLVGEYRN